MSSQQEPSAPGKLQKEKEADDLAATQHLLASSICLNCSSHRTIVSGKGSVFMLCQLQEAPLAWPKYPPQPVARCKYFVAENES